MGTTNILVQTCGSITEVLHDIVWNTKLKNGVCSYIHPGSGDINLRSGEFNVKIILRRDLTGLYCEEPHITINMDRHMGANHYKRIPTSLIGSLVNDILVDLGFVQEYRNEKRYRMFQDDARKGTVNYDELVRATWKVNREYYGIRKKRRDGLEIKETYIDDLIKMEDCGMEKATDIRVKKSVITSFKYGHIDSVKDISLNIKKVIFNGPATIVIWLDGTKTVVKCNDGDTYDPEKGMAMAIAKRVLGTNESGSNYYDEFRTWLPEDYDINEEEPEPVKCHDYSDRISWVSVNVFRIIFPDISRSTIYRYCNDGTMMARKDSDGTWQIAVEENRITGEWNWVSGGYYWEEGVTD